jgi:competence protein ComEC
MPEDAATAKALKMATGSDLLRSQVLKVSHHASKHGVNLELIERISPVLTLISCVDGGGSYHFPTQSPKNSSAKHSNQPPPPAPHTNATTNSTSTTPATPDGPPAEPLGSFGIIINKSGQTVWRFRDQTNQNINLTNARQLNLA